MDASQEAAMVRAVCCLLQELIGYDPMEVAWQWLNATPQDQSAAWLVGGRRGYMPRVR